jgi:hypothetical protein
VKDPTYAPVYCAMYPELAKIARKHGYAFAIHGTLGRDMDLTCIPWAETVSEPQAVLDEITSTFAVKLLPIPPTQKNHGRVAYTISIGWGECAIDISFMPARNSDGAANLARDGEGEG